MIKRTLLTIAVAAAALTGSAAAGNTGFLDNYNITCRTMKDGMANNHVDDVFRDSKGFLWVSYLGGGLSRYDGYSFINFSDAAGDRNIRSGFVSMVNEDRLGRLWVAGDAGIDIIDLATMAPVTPGDATRQFDRLSHEPATDLTFDSHGVLWVGGSQKVSRVEFDDEGNIIDIASLPVRGVYHRGIALREIDGEMWTGTNGTVSRIDRRQDGSLYLVPVSKKLSNLPLVDYFSDFVKKGSEVWIATNNGLYRYDPATDMSRHYESIVDDETTLSQNFLTDVAVTSGGRLLVSSLRGLNVYNPLDDTFERTLSSSHNLNNQFVNMMLVSGDDIIIGTEGGGINILTPRSMNLNIITHNENDPGSLSDNPVNAIAEGPDGSIWVGTVEGGLNVRRPGEKYFTHIKAEQGTISHNSVSALAFDSMDRLWVGTWGGGVSVISTKPPYRKIMQVEPMPGDSIDLWFVGSIIYDPLNDGMVLGTGSGVSYYELGVDVLHKAISTGDDFDAFGFVGSEIDHKNRLWMGSAKGLLVIDLNRRLDDGTFAFEYDPNPIRDLTHNVVLRPSCFYEAPGSTMWIGTNGQGLIHGVRDAGDNMHYTCYTTDDGLANNAVRGIAGAPGGRLWVATMNGLSLFDPERNHFTTYTDSDGLPCSQFYWNATCPTSTGSILFGTTCGIAEVLPDGIGTDREAPPVVLTRLYVGYTPVNGADGRITDRDIAYTDHITIHESDKTFTVEFAALDYESQSGGVYSYRLKGFSNDWVIVGPGNRYATYTNLSPGQYTLQVKYLPEGGDADVPVTELGVTVRPYFYKSVWFIILVVLMVLACGYFFYAGRVKDLKRQRQMLENQVEKRTAQLAEQKKLVEERAGELAERNRQLTARNEEISNQKMQLTEMNRKVNKLTMDRIQFFTSITHEFRTPISLIIGPIRRALRLSTNEQVIEQLHFVERNSRYLLSLVNQLMDFRKVESGKMEISYTNANMRRFVDEIITPFQPVAAERGITVRSLCRLPQGDSVVFDEDSMRKVLINLVSNAIKYTPDNGCVTVYVAMGSKLYIGVSDTGSGVAEADKDHIFERFYQGENNLKYPLPGAGDSGIGLYVCRTIVELHGGTISVKNNRRAGCTFRVIVPLPDIDPSSVSQAESDTASNVQALAPYDPEMQERKTILVVEDNDDMRAFICSILRDRYAIVEARDGLEALKVLSEQTVDFIVSDLMMPRMDGLELSRRVKENFAISHIPFLMLTAKTSKESRIDSYRTGVDDYLLKPFDEQVLLARIEGIMHARRMLQHRFSDTMDTNALDIVAESRDKKFIDQVMEAVKNNYRNSYFEVDDFAEAMGISRSLLNKKLQSLMGQSAGQLVRNYRLNMAREIIIKNRKTRALNISEIAYEVGFNDSKYFTRSFTKHFNITPSGMMNSTGD